MNEQGLLNALHGIQLWGIVGQSMDPSLGMIRCGSNDEFLEAYRELENEVIRHLISENERLKAESEKLDEETGRMFAVQLTEDAARRHLGKVNSPVYDMNGMLIGWLGDRLPDRGFPCEYAELAGDGALVCDELTRANRLCYENDRLRRLVIALNWCTESAFGPGTECENCPLGDDRSSELTCENMMRELGIKVE